MFITSPKNPKLQAQISARAAALPKTNLINTKSSRYKENPLFSAGFFMRQNVLENFRYAST